MNIFKIIPTPTMVGSSEYRAIYEVLTDGPECANNPRFTIEVCREFKFHAQTIINLLEKQLVADGKR